MLSSKSKSKDISTRTELTKLLYKQSGTIQALGILTAVISTMLFWDVANHTHMLFWFFLISVIYSVRMIVSIKFNQISRNEFSLKKWNSIYILGTFITGVIWSGLALQYDASWHASHLVMLFIIYTGITASAFNTHSSVFVAFPSFYLPPVIALMYITVTHSDSYGWQLAFLFMIYIVMMFVSALKYHNHLVELFETRFKNEKLTSELIEVNKELAKLADIDGLTGISNRRSMDKFLINEWNRHYRYQHPLSFLLIDLDYFKQYNDTYGHDGGDKCLKTVSKLLDEQISRSSDLAARYGGEEFVVILTETDEIKALKVAERIRTSLRDLNIQHINSRVSENVTVSIGIATTIPKQNDASNQLVLTADKALYQAKREGRDRAIQRVYSSNH